MMEIQYYEHTCLCGCGGKIEIKEYHKYNGIPKYIHNHHLFGKHPTEETKKKQSEGNKGKKRTEEQKQRYSEAFKGKPKSEEHQQNMSKSQKDRLSISENHPFYGKNHTEESRQKQSEAKKGIIPWNKGLTKIDDVRILSGEKHPMFGVHRFGEISPNWNNGSSFEPYSPEFNNELKQQILERDNYICQCPECEHKTNILDCHHIDYDKKNNMPENIIILCRSCHARTFGKNRKQYYAEFYQNIMINRLIECLL